MNRITTVTVDDKPLMVENAGMSCPFCNTNYMFTAVYPVGTDFGAKWINYKRNFLDNHKKLCRILKENTDAKEKET